MKILGRSILIGLAIRKKKKNEKNSGTYRLQSYLRAIIIIISECRLVVATRDNNGNKICYRDLVNLVVYLYPTVSLNGYKRVVLRFIHKIKISHLRTGRSVRAGCRIGYL